MGGNSAKTIAQVHPRRSICAPLGGRRLRGDLRLTEFSSILNPDAYQPLSEQWPPPIRWSLRRTTFTNQKDAGLVLIHRGLHLIGRQRALPTFEWRTNCAYFNTKLSISTGSLFTLMLLSNVFLRLSAEAPSLHFYELFLTVTAYKRVFFALLKKLIFSERAELAKLWTWATRCGH